MLFRDTMMGSQFRHTPRFPGPPCDPGRSDFPSPVLTSACPSTACPRPRKLKRWRVYAPLGCGLLMDLAPFLRARVTPARSPGPAPGPPSAQGSFARNGCCPNASPRPARSRRELPQLRRSYEPMRQTMCLPPTSLLYGGSLQVVASPCWQMALPDVISTVCVQALGPLPRRVPSVLTRFFPKDIGLALEPRGLAHRDDPCNATSTGALISGLQSFANVRAPVLARPSGCTHNCGSPPAERQGRIHHAGLMKLPVMSSGIATSPNRAIETAGLAPARLWPCRPLPRLPQSRILGKTRLSRSFALPTGRMDMGFQTEPRIQQPCDGNSRGDGAV